MNINLTGAKKQNKGKNLSFGLNKRKKPVANVFDDGDSDDSSEEDAPQDTAKSRRDAVNREIEAEQKALRDRAKKVMTDSGKGTLYDYDAAYDSMQTKKDQKDEQMAASKEKRSRYIQDLLKTSEKRAVEREAIYERKVAREQEEEDAQADYRGKEKFVTKAYKRKLEERKKMAAEDEKQKKLEEQEDVTKRTGGAAMASFYRNMNRSVAMGGADTNENKEEATKSSKKDASAGGGLDFLSGFERADGDDDDPKARGTTDEEKAGTQSKEDTPKKKVKLDPLAQNRATRKARAEKLAKARVRYFQRNDMTLQKVS